MSKNKIAMAVAAFLMMVGMLSMGLNYIVAGVVTIVVLVIFNGGRNFNQYKDRADILQADCDPEAFLKMTKEMKAQSSSNAKMRNYLNIDEAVGEMALGHFEQAKSILLSIEVEKLPSKYHMDLIYKMNLMYTHYELGDIEAAEFVYEDVLPLLSVDDLHVKLTKEVLLAERAYFIGEFEEAKQLIAPLLERELKKRTKLTLIYRLAQIAEQEGDIRAALEHYTHVAKEGNQLYIASCANLKVSELKG